MFNGGYEVKNCATCEHRAELNPDFQSMDWAEIPCSRCESGTLQMDKPSPRMALLSTDLIDRKFSQGVPSRPMKDARRADLLSALLRRALEDPKDASIIAYMMANPEATHAEIGVGVNMKAEAVRKRIARMSA
jgi:hypothetical protein